MKEYPVISIILVGNSSLQKTEQSILELKKLEYPKDQLRYILVLPPTREKPSNLTVIPNIRIVTFKKTYTHNLLSLKLEALSLIKSEYVQFLHSNYSLHENWINNSISYFKNHISGVRGTFQTTNTKNTFDLSEDSDQENNELNQFNNNYLSSFYLDDGLYDTNILQYFYFNHEKSYRHSAARYGKILSISKPMAKVQQEEFKSTPANNKKNSLVSIFKLF